MNTSTAIILASLSAMTQQAFAGQVINFNPEKTDGDLVDVISSKLNTRVVDSLVKSNAVVLSDVVLFDGEKMINIDVFLASNSDSTSNGGTSNSAVSYSNCHTACHSGRSWR